jgi:AcrR family transcriptional regulator
LYDALASLIREKAHDSISVKEILDRANVGRSTFYMHFRDKDDLLVSGIHDMLRSIPPKGSPSPTGRYDRIIGFSLPIFEHIYQHRRTGDARRGPGRERSFMDTSKRRSLNGLPTTLERIFKDAERRRVRSHRIFLSNT